MKHLFEASEWRGWCVKQVKGGSHCFSFKAVSLFWRQEENRQESQRIVLSHFIQHSSCWTRKFFFSVQTQWVTFDSSLHSNNFGCSTCLHWWALSSHYIIISRSQWVKPFATIQSLLWHLLCQCFLSCVTMDTPCRAFICLLITVYAINTWLHSVYCNGKTLIRKGCNLLQMCWIPL